MNELLVIGAVYVGVLFVVGAAWRFRLMSGGPRVPVWFHALVLAIAIAGLVVAIAWGSWLSVATFASLTLLWSVLLLEALRRRRAGG